MAPPPPPPSPPPGKSLEVSFNPLPIGLINIPNSKGFLLHHIDSLKGVVKQTAIEYTQASSLHGVQYVFEGGRRLKASRVLWLGLALAAATVGIIWSIEVGCLEETDTCETLHTCIYNTPFW